MGSSKSAWVLIDTICGILDEDPVDFAITVLGGGKDQARSWWEGDNLKSCLVLQDGHFGLEARALPSMTRTIRSEYKDLRGALHNATGDAAGKDAVKQQPVRARMLKATLCLLLVNPDHATVWADRRRCILHRAASLVDDEDSQQMWRSELKFLDLLMTQHSKAPSSWAHRKFVVNQIVQTADETDSGADTYRPQCWNDKMAIARGEIETCHRVAEQFPKNYYAWTHRWWMLRYLHTGTTIGDGSTGINTDAQRNLDALLKVEWDAIIAWLHKHISDHSAVHYGCQVLHLLLANDEESGSDASGGIGSKGYPLPMDRHAFVLDALQSVRDLVDKFDDHESLWIFRRTIVAVVAMACRSTSQGPMQEAWKSQIWPSLVEHDIRSVYRRATTNHAAAEGPRAAVSTHSTSSAAAKQPLTISPHAWSYLMWVKELFCQGSGRDGSNSDTQSSFQTALQENEISLADLETDCVASLLCSRAVHHQMWHVLQGPKG